MLSEDFDKKIKDAADHHHPAYDEKAWLKMERLLDKHLPQEEEKKRRFLFILLFFLLAGGGTWLYFGSHGKATSKIVSENRVDQNRKGNNTAGSPAGSKEINSGIQPGHQPTTVTGNQAGKKDENPLSPELRTNNFTSATQIPGKPSGRPSNEKIIPAILPKSSLVRINRPGGKNLKASSTGKEIVAKTAKPVSSSNDKDPVPDVSAPKQTTDATVKNDLTSQVETKPSENKIAEVRKEPAVSKENEKDITAINSKEQKKSPAAKSKKLRAFSISASVGPDMSIVGLSEMGRMKMVAGAGIGYTRGRFTLRTGFYTARKVYDAYGDNYHAPSAFYSYYPNFQKVKADCKVYELPLNVSYSFGKKSNRSWFVSAGMSTYIMKRETYDFYYKYTPTSPTVNRKRTIYNSNEHWFSVASISGGYQHKINNTISIAAEPYVKIPVTGIGFGKVKLNSAGILVSAVITPFHAKQKK
jgi:hypothetical protein